MQLPFEGVATDSSGSATNHPQFEPYRGSAREKAARIDINGPWDEAGGKHRRPWRSWEKGDRFWWSSVIAEHAG